MIKDFFKLIFLLALAYAGYQLFTTGSIQNPFGDSGGPSAFSSARSREISGGERVDLAANAMKGGVTLYYFTAKWCAPCKAFGPQLHQYASSKQGVAIRRIDIGKFGSPVTKQYQIQSVPQVWIADSNGRIVTKVAGPNLRTIEKSVAPLLPRKG